MNALEEMMAMLDKAKKEAIDGDDAARLRFANLVLASWHTIHRALDELNRRRIA